MRSLFACCAALLTTIVIVASVGGQGTIPRLASTFKGTIHNITYNVKTTLELTSIVENQGNISGKVVIGPGLGGSGPFTGTMDTNGSVNFEVNSIFFKGSLRPDGSFGGTYRTNVNQEGTWQTTAVTQAEEKRSPELGAIPVDQQFLGRYIGTAENTTERQRGHMSMDIERSDKKGYVQLKILWKEGLIGEGTLIGTIAADGKLSATGTTSENVIFIFRPSKAWDCNLTGMISDNRLKGNYSLFPKTVGESTPPIPGYPKWTTDAAEGSFDLEKFKPLVQPQ